MGYLQVILLLLFGCSAEEAKPLALDFDRDTKGYYCSMPLVEHSGPKAQIHLAGEKNALWFSSVRDAFVFFQLEGATRRLRGFFVNHMDDRDWSRPGPWIDGEQAHYVVGSHQQSSMGETELVPFAGIAAAQAFAASHGGQVMTFGQARSIDMVPAASH